MKAPARATDPETSHIAAASVDRARSQRIVLAALWEVGPMPHHKLAHMLRGAMSESRCRTAVAELRDAGLVRDSGLRTDTPRGRKAVIWEVVLDG